MRNFGLKLWSMDFLENENFVKSAEIALKEGKFPYFELFALPDTYSLVENKVYNFKGIKTIIHAPHIRQGFDPSNKDNFKHNQALIADSFKFADLLGATIIITHPGVRSKNSLEENLRQFKGFNDQRITVENMPYTCSSSHNDLEGAYPHEIKRFIDELSCQFCFDFSHAICTANRVGLDVYSVLGDFYAFKPAMYHLCDGDIKSADDNHLHYGDGNYDLKRLVHQYIDPNGYVTMETGKGLPSSLEPWLKDLNYVKKFDF